MSRERHQIVELPCQMFQVQEMMQRIAHSFVSPLAQTRSSYRGGMNIYGKSVQFILLNRVSQNETLRYCIRDFHVAYGSCTLRWLWCEPGTSKSCTNRNCTRGNACGSGIPGLARRNEPEHGTCRRDCTGCATGWKTSGHERSIPAQSTALHSIPEHSGASVYEICRCISYIYIS